MYVEGGGLNGVKEGRKEKVTHSFLFTLGDGRRHTVIQFTAPLNVKMNVHVELCTHNKWHMASFVMNFCFMNVSDSRHCPSTSGPEG